MSEEFRAILYPNSSMAKIIRVPQIASDSDYSSDEKLLIMLDDERNNLREQLKVAMARYKWIQESDPYYLANDIEALFVGIERDLAEIERIGKNNGKTN